jgi:ribosomal protein L11 methyltransferase
VRTWPALLVSGPDDLFQAALADFDGAAIEELSDDRWRVFFPSAAVRDAALAALRQRFPHILLDAAAVADEDWAARSQAELRAVRAGALVVAPPWDVPSDAATVITILPSTGFGTGHHPTTRLCLQALQLVDVRGRSVLDVGTGSGVLAIAASRLGAADVVGIDDDADAVEAARANLALNPGARVTWRVGDFRREPLSGADIVLANLTGGLLVSAAGVLQQLTRAGGRLILSGVTADEAAAVLAAYRDRAIEHRAQEGGWICATLQA